MRNIPGKASGGQGSVRPGAGAVRQEGEPPPAPRPRGWRSPRSVRCRESRRGWECFVKPALPYLSLPLLFPYLCWHLTWKAACGARAFRRERPRPRAERPGPRGCGGTAAQGRRPAGPSVSLLARKHGEIHQSGPKDGVRAPWKGSGRPGAGRAAADGHGARTGQSPASPALRAPGLKVPRFPIPSALPTCTRAQPWHYSPPTVGGGKPCRAARDFDPPRAMQPAGRSALPQRPGRQPQPSPQSPEKGLTWWHYGAALLRVSASIPPRCRSLCLCPVPSPAPRKGHRSLPTSLPRPRRSAPPPPRCFSHPAPRRDLPLSLHKSGKLRRGAKPPRPPSAPRSQVAAPARPRGWPGPPRSEGRTGPGAAAAGAPSSPPRSCSAGPERRSGDRDAHPRPGKVLPSLHGAFRLTRLTGEGLGQAMQPPGTPQEMTAAGTKPPAKDMGRLCEDSILRTLPLPVTAPWACSTSQHPGGSTPTWGLAHPAHPPHWALQREPHISPPACFKTKKCPRAAGTDSKTLKVCQFSLKHRTH